MCSSVGSIRFPFEPVKLYKTIDILSRSCFIFIILDIFKFVLNNTNYLKYPIYSITLKIFPLFYILGICNFLLS